jgi:RNA polymerase sigma-70 factor (ECF subfamily)
MKEDKNIVLHDKLLEYCRKGDAKAQFRIYELYYKAIYNTCFRLLRNHHLAEEAMQDSFLNAFHKLDQYKGEVAFGAWLKKIAINKALDILKSQKVYFQSFDDSTEVLNIENETIELEDSHSTIETIRQTIELLPDGYRIILSLALIEGFDHDEISEFLGISASTSRSQLTRAKRKLIEQLSQLNLIYSHGKLRKFNS